MTNARIPGPDGSCLPCRKATVFVGNLPHLEDLAKQCPGHSTHVHAIGVRTAQGWKRRSVLAGVCTPRNSVQRTQGWLVTLSAPQTGQPKLDATNLGVATTCLAPLFCRKRKVWFSQTETRLVVAFSACHGCTAFKKEKQAAFRFARLSEPYRLRLTHSLRKFGDYCNDSGVSLSRVLRSAVLADRLLSSFVLKAHATMRPGELSMVKHAALACQALCPALRGHLPETWANVKTWQEKTVGRLRPPLPVPIWVALLSVARAPVLGEVTHNLPGPSGQIFPAWWNSV